MKFLFLWIFILFLFFVTKSRADEWFYPKVYKGVIFACISEKISDTEMDTLQLTAEQLKSPEIKFIGCKIQEKETETYDDR
jgi:hypothetical protein